MARCENSYSATKGNVLAKERVELEKGTTCSAMRACNGVLELCKILLQVFSLPSLDDLDRVIFPFVRRSVLVGLSSLEHDYESFWNLRYFVLSFFVLSRLFLSFSVLWCVVLQ